MNEQRIRDAFAGVQADAALKQRTRVFLHRRTRPRIGLRLAAATLCTLCLIFGVSGAYVYFLPTAVISIDVNPSIEISLNRFDRVIGVEPFNDDGAALADELDVRYSDFATALGQILQNESILQYLASGEELTIIVTGTDDAQNQQILTLARQSTARKENIYCGSSMLENMEAAHACGLSHGKYQAGMELMALDVNVTTDDIRQMTMKEIRTAVQSHHASEHGHGSHEHRQDGGRSQTHSSGGHGSGGRHGHGH